MDFEDVFCSKTRMKILKLLLTYGQLNTSTLARRLKANYETAMKHLTLLQKEDLVEQRLSGRTRFFRLTNTSKGQVVKKLLEEWE